MQSVNTADWRLNTKTPGAQLRPGGQTKSYSFLNYFVMWVQVTCP